MTATSDASPRLSEDLPCMACGYLLRGLAADGRCPECGRAIEDSRRAVANQPAAAVRALRLGIVALIVALLGRHAAEAFAFADSITFNFGGYLLDRRGTQYLIVGLLLVPPARWLTRARKFSAHTSRSRERIVLAMPILLITMAIGIYAMLIASRGRIGTYIATGVSSPWRQILLALYALTPLVMAVTVIVQIGEVAKLSKPIPRTLRPFWIRLAQCVIGAALLLDPLENIPITTQTILLELGVTHQSAGPYVPPTWVYLLEPVARLRVAATTPMVSLGIVLLIAQAISVFRATRFTTGARHDVPPGPRSVTLPAP